ncbi:MULTISPECIES: plasmid partitioning protein RepB [unclassified Shinella]|uniref:plasmid partitioning protein RepB n=1 Tax=unclassified Shinella TaxID=2643062 RepID=UPI00225C9864|nr:plasmid partitioning protein RepB [Shinella sp. YE25]MDC7259781.1 plasmid partitioning protein RepB [Shinella sp. YE25]CAI0334042.1 Plasmid partitioning protein RepB [Rhizobiaceae bacterium]CAK7261690.1 ParB family transcriptional regulator, chromosome partitioning protein [Shinella sp. WSC3-e]
MKKSILQRMAADAENRGDAAPASDGTDRIGLTRRHSSPVVSNVGRALSHLSEDVIVSLDPSKVEASPFKDRFEYDAEADEKFGALKFSIATEGQRIPVLVRPHPTKRDHYQLAYGRRRRDAVLAIMAEADRPETIKIRAYVRDLTDRQLIEEQTLENGPREDLSWIEKAMWAVQLKASGISQREIASIMGLSEVAVSQMFRVTSAIPEDIIFAIGRAQSAGRPKWTAFAELLKDASKVDAVRKIVPTAEFQQADGAGRISLAMRATTSPVSQAEEHLQEEILDFVIGGRVFGRMKSTFSGTIVTIPKKEQVFARWLAERMPELMREFNAADPSQ